MKSKRFTPPQVRLVEHMVMTDQPLNLSASGEPYLPDGYRPHTATVQALIKRGALVECQRDIFGDRVTAYTLNRQEERADL